MAQTVKGIVGQVKIGNDQYLVGSTLFGTCSSGSTDATKQVILVGEAYYSDATGITVHVKFDNANTITGSTLKLQIKNGESSYSTAQQIVNPNGALTWAENSIISFTNDGTNWVINASAIDGSSIQNLSLGNITNSGTLSNTDATIANNDQLVIVDADDNSGRIAKASLKFDGSTTTKALTQAGTWETFNNYSLPTANYQTLGGLKPAYSSSGAVTLTTTAASNSDTPTIAAKSATSDRYYAIEVDTNGVPYVNVPWTDTKVTQTSKSDNVAYKFLFTNVASPSSGTAYTAVYATTLSYNPSTRILTVTGKSGNPGTIKLTDGTNTTSLTPSEYGGNAATASAVAWSGVTSTPTTLTGYGITDALSTSSSITIAGNSVSLNSGSLDATTLRTSLGLASALRFIGTTSTEMTDGRTTAAIRLTGADSDTTPTTGDVVIDSNSDSEYVWTGSIWERLGRDGSYALDNTVIHNSLLTAAGDIIIGTTSNNVVVPTRLAKGTDGYVLTIDPTTHLPSWKANVASSALYVNATAGGAASESSPADAAVTSGSTYIHFYNDTTKQSTISLTGAGGTTITATNSKAITISSQQYWAVNEANALTSLTLGYSSTTESVTSGTASQIGYVNSGILYIKSITFGTTSVTTSLTSTEPTT